MLTKIGVKQTIRTTPALAQILLGTVMHVAVNMVGARQWCGVVLIVINGGIGLASRGGVPRLRLLAPAVTVGERRELWILPPFFFGLFFCL